MIRRVDRHAKLRSVLLKDSAQFDEDDREICFWTFHILYSTNGKKYLS